MVLFMGLHLEFGNLNGLQSSEGIIQGLHDPGDSGMCLWIYTWYMYTSKIYLNIVPVPLVASLPATLLFRQKLDDFMGESNGYLNFMDFQ